MNRPPSALDLLATHAIARRSQKLRKQLDRLADDPQASEPIHQLRVASRRLRAALRGFPEALPPKTRKRSNKLIRKLAQALGPVRDADVQLHFLDHYIDSHSPAKSSPSIASPCPALPGIKRLHLRITQQRHRFAARIPRALDRFQSSSALQSLPQAPDQLPDLSDPALKQHADQAITSRILALLEYAPFVDQPDCVEPLHRMRIAAKLLRYTLELYEPILNSKQKKLLARTRDLQSLLGDLHDCDLWITLLPQFLEDERQRILEYQGTQRGFKRIAASIQHLLHDRQLARSVSYQALHGYWHRLQQNHAFDLPAPTPTPPSTISPIPPSTD